MVRAFFIPRHARILSFAIFLFAIFTSPASAQEILFETYTDLQSPVWGRIIPTATHRIAQDFTPEQALSVCEVGHKVKRGSANDADDIVMRVYEGGDVPEVGILIAEVFIPRSELGMVFPPEAVRFTLPSCLTLQPDVTYWFVWAHSNPYYLRRDGFISTYRATDQVENSTYWQYEGYVAKGGEGWKEYPDREWSFTLFGNAPETKTPVIIVPGILGSELKIGDDLLWPDLAQMLLDAGDDFLVEGLRLNTEGVSENTVAVGGVVEAILAEVPFFEVNIFRNLLSELLSFYESNEIVYFPYDWRLDLGSTKDLLKEKIEQVKGVTGKEKVDLVVHSMGGLVAKAYIAAYGSESINKLIFVGTPHLGAPKASKAILFGEQFNIPVLNSLAMKAIALNAPAVYELTPSPIYFDQAQGYLSRFREEDLLGYAETKDVLLDSGVNWGLLDNAEAFFAQELAHMDFGALNVYNIVGCNLSTQSAYELNEEEDGVEAIGYRSGDATVPLASAEYIQTEHKYYVNGVKHTELPSASGVRELIAMILTDAPIVLSSGVSDSNSGCGFSGKEVIWHSPVEAHVFDEFQRHTGPDEYGSIEYGIPGVDYEIIGEHKFIFLPANGKYRVVATGLANGTFDLFIRENENGEIRETRLFNDVVITPESRTEFMISDESADSEIVIYEGEQREGVVMSSSVVEGLAQGDVLTFIELEEGVEQQEVVSEVGQGGVVVAIVEEVHKKSGPTRSGFQPQVLGATITAEEWRADLMRQLIELMTQLIVLLQEQQRIR